MNAPSITATKRTAPARTAHPAQRPRRRVPTSVIIMAILFVCWLTGWLLAQ